jgi:predicted HD phosphohydrolase
MEKTRALYYIFGSMAHEVGHYYQWVDDEELDEEESEEGAENFRDEVLDEYFQKKEKP